jgi:microcystin degradation protein MlrC
VHFRAEFEPIAEEVLLVAAPGLVPERIEDLPYKNLRKGVRLRPMGATFKGT